MKRFRAVIAAGLLLGPAGCDSDPDLAAVNLPAVGRAPPAATLLRIPPEGGLPRLYRVPTLEPSSWKAQDKVPPLERNLGTDPELGLVFLLDKKRTVLGLDLETRRVRPYLEQVRHATTGPDGVLYAVDTASRVTQLVRRTPVRFRSKLQGAPREVYGTMGGALIARLGGPAPVLEVLGSDQPPASIVLAGGAMALSFWGDLVAVAADTAVVLYETQGERARRSIPVSGHATAVLFSPSGHRIYVGRKQDGLLVLDRTEGEQLAEIELPGPVAGLRGDQYGQWILVRPERGDSVWVVDVGRGRLAGTASVKWDEDLPAVLSPNTLVTRRGRDVVALDLGAEGLPERARIENGAADRWLPLAWQPGQDEEVPAESDSVSLADAAESAVSGRSVYLQVSSSQNPAWAEELSQKLQAVGLPASVLPPRRSDQSYRVVLGPYATREQAEDAGRKIGMPSFVVTAQDATER